MTEQPNYKTVEVTADKILIRDIGPWDKHKTVTNAPEVVVKSLAAWVKTRRLEVIDSDGLLWELKTRQGKFAGWSRLKD